MKWDALIDSYLDQIAKLRQREDEYAIEACTRMRKEVDELRKLQARERRKAA